VTDLGDAPTHYQVAEAGAAPNEGAWQAALPATYTLAAAPAEGTLVYLVGWAKLASGAIVPSAPKKMLCTSFGMAEIAKNTMSISASAESDGGVWALIDNNFAIRYNSLGSNCVLGNAPQWIRIQFNRRVKIGMITYMGRTDYRPDTINGYQVYVTDDPDPATWTTPNTTGNLLNNAAAQDIVLTTPSEGRYLVIKGTSAHNRVAGASCGCTARMRPASPARWPTRRPGAQSSPMTPR